MKTARQNTEQEKLFVFSLVYLTGSTPFVGLSEKSEGPFCVLKKVERIAKNRVSGAKTVPKTKTPANLGRNPALLKSLIMTAIYALELLIEKVFKVVSQKADKGIQTVIRADTC